MSGEKRGVSLGEKKAGQDALWQRYAHSKEPEVKEQIILEYAHLIKFVAGRLSAHIGTYVEYDDMLSYGIFGLIDAIDKFDAHKGAQFETYASLRIRGAIIDGVRKMDWAPRALRVKSKNLEKVYAELEKELGREPTDEELAEKLGVGADEAKDIVSKHAVASVVSLDDFLEQNHETQIAADSEAPEEVAERNEANRILADAIDKLNDKERVVITAYYYEEMTLREIAAIIGVTESRVSQIHSKAVLKLKSKLGGAKAVFSLD
jgi:RNA polymerase sigma factor for flagellar operon FliA